MSTYTHTPSPHRAYLPEVFYLLLTYLLLTLIISILITWWADGDGDGRSRWCISGGGPPGQAVCPYIVRDADNKILLLSDAGSVRTQLASSDSSHYYCSIEFCFLLLHIQGSRRREKGGRTW